MAVNRDLLHDAKLGRNDKRWFPRWIRRYAAAMRVREGALPVSEDQVIHFSRTLLQNGTPAWQRLQAVRAVEAYRNLVLKTETPSLLAIRQTLSRLADRERADGREARPGTRDEPQLVGLIDPSEPETIQQMRRELRVRRKSLDTERAYVGWVIRFFKHCGSGDVSRVGEPEIRRFLTHLAVDANVSSSTQNQAKSALLFLFQSVLGRDLGFLDAAASHKPTRLPVVLSRDEIARLLPQFDGLQRLMFLVLYGAGLRHRECRRLRVKDVCFDEGHIVVRNGKGDQDRITVLPDAAASHCGNRLSGCKICMSAIWIRDSELIHKDERTTMIYLHVMNKPGWR